MSEKSQNLEQSISLALEAAAAANDTADEVAKLSTDTQQAADRLDKLGKGMKPALYGVLAGAVVSIGLAGVIYLKTLSEMRTFAATQVEALGVFTKTVGELKTGLETINEMKASQVELTAAQEAAFARIEAALSPAPEDDSAASGNMSSQMLSALPDFIEQSHLQTREAVVASISDLQLALSRMLANRPVPETTAAPDVAPAAPPVATKRASQRPVPRSTRVSKPRPKPAPNPFTYP